MIDTRDPRRCPKCGCSNFEHWAKLNLDSNGQGPYLRLVRVMVDEWGSGSLYLRDGERVIDVVVPVNLGLLIAVVEWQATP